MLAPPSDMSTWVLKKVSQKTRETFIHCLQLCLERDERKEGEEEYFRQGIIDMVDESIPHPVAGVAKPEMLAKIVLLGFNSYVKGLIEAWNKADKQYRVTEFLLYGTQYKPALNELEALKRVILDVIEEGNGRGRGRGGSPSPSGIPVLASWVTVTLPTSKTSVLVPMGEEGESLVSDGSVRTMDGMSSLVSGV